MTNQFAPREICKSLTVLTMAVVSFCHSTTGLGEDWPRWRGPRGDGTWQGPKLPERWPEGGLRRIWRQPIGGGFAGIVAVGNRVYTMDRQTEPAEVERVLAFDADSGRLVWSHAYPVTYGKLDHGNGPRAAPTVFAGRVYTLGAVGHVCCLDAATGTPVWTHDMVREFQARVPEWGFAASPVIDGDTVVVHTGAEPNGSFIALDRQTGREVWRSLPDPAGYCTPIVVESGGLKQLVCWTPENIRGLDAATGRVLWSVPYKVTLGVSIATPIFHEGIVFVSGYWEGSKAIRLGRTPTEAELVWEDNRNLRGLMSQPLYRDGHVYSLDKQHGLTCFELRSGRKLWDDDNRMTPKGRNPQATMVWLGDRDRVIVLSSDGELILARFNTAGYHEDSRTKLIGPTWAHPAYAGDRVFARNDQEIVCVSLRADADGGQ